ncbi:helix-turn-helix domain-containing protein [Roseivirga sp.]|uniref:AraC family transcriptional regulator n=1 Tax=Roseivirga sp. TaxID=1964215 RepID=UPI003B522301
MQLSDKFYKERKLQTLVENQTTYTVNSAELHVFETHQEADRVLLQFDQPVLASMLTGKKVMHLRDYSAFDFLPGESLILPSSEVMCIDFPEAHMNNPTRCLAMTIDEDRIRNVINDMNEHMPKADDALWRFTDYNFHFTNEVAINQIIQKLMFLFTENHPAKDLFVNMSLKELIVRLLQTETRKIYSEKAISMSSSNRLAFVIAYIRENLHEPLTIEELSEKVCMSPSHFHRVFKNEMGISPVNFINNERIKLAESMLKDPAVRIKEVYMACGFNSLSYFNRMFKRQHNLSPKAYKNQSNSIRLN